MDPDELYQILKAQNATGPEDEAPQIETIEDKANRLEDFMYIAEDAHLVLKDLFEMFDKVESFLKSSDNFKQTCLSLHQKSTLIMDWQDQLHSFVKGLEEIKKREKYLDFDPILNSFGKLETLSKLKLAHGQHLIESEENADEVENLLETYNDIVERISD